MKKMVYNKSQVSQNYLNVLKLDHLTKKLNDTIERLQGRQMFLFMEDKS